MFDYNGPMGGRVHHDKDRIFRQLRQRIAEELKADGLDVKPVSQLELAIGTFVPSEIVAGFGISDYPFIGARYVSIRDSHIYIVAGSTDDGSEVLAYRLGYLQSTLSVRGGHAVGISADGWMQSRMILYSLQHAHFGMADGVIQSVNDEQITRRTFPEKKWSAYKHSIKKRLFSRDDGRL